MDKAAHILLPSAMTSPDVRALFAALDPNQQREALFVGGCVRGAMLGRAEGDIDIATTLPPNEGMSLLTAKGFKVIPTGVEHGTLTVVVGKTPFEVTTLRRDVSTDGRRAVVAYTKDWREDANRRDFTMNTLLADMEGNIYDPLGRGLEDLKNRRVVFVGDPEQRIREDYLRILRFFRFHAFYGEGDPDLHVLRVCEKFFMYLFDISIERVSAEFLKILGSPRALSVLVAMSRHNILNNIVTSRFDPLLMKRGLALGLRESGQKEESELAARLLMLGGLDSSCIEVFETGLRLSNALKNLMYSIKKAFEHLDKIEKFDLKFLLYRYGRDVAREALRIRLAVNKDSSDHWIRFLETENPPEFPLRGANLLAAGFLPGPEMGKQLEALEKRWIDSGFRLSGSDLMKSL